MSSNKHQGSGAAVSVWEEGADNWGALSGPNASHPHLQIQT